MKYNAPATVARPGAGLSRGVRDVDKVITEPERRTCVAIFVRRGREELVRRIAPALRVVREDGKPPRVEPLEPSAARA